MPVIFIFVSSDIFQKVLCRYIKDQNLIITKNCYKIKFKQEENI